jgi:CheY-like chemotaxis protein
MLDCDWSSDVCSSDLAIALANDGQQAVEIVRARGAGDFSVVLMDVEMPVMNGLDATRAIHELDPGLPVIAQTAYAQPEELDRCMAAGMADRLSKPIDHELLVTKVIKWSRRA